MYGVCPPRELQYLITNKIYKMYINNKLPKWLYTILNVSNMFFCRHNYENGGIRKTFNDPKMDSNGKLTYKMQLKVCTKCGKIKYIGVD